ncbi:MAG: YCF48-related protein [Bacteroidota bacterium]|jgi:photosystem II stability/assembly factor-like uncharacterized protein
MSGTSRALRGVKLVSRSKAFVVGDSGTVLSTMNAGGTWIAMNSPVSADLFGIAFTDSLKGMVVGNGGTILQTNDGGTTWLRRNSGTLFRLSAVAFRDSLRATAVGDGGTILNTTNGGVTWHRQASGTTNNLRGVSFSTPTTGTAVGDDATILRSNDGGMTWKQQGGTLGSLAGVAFLDSLRGCVTALENMVWHTTDGGASWFLKTNPPCCGSLNAVTFTKVDTGIVVGNLGRVFRTTDAGRSWTPQAVNSSSDWLAVSFLDESTGVVVGSQGEIIRTISGGGDSIVFPVRLVSPANGALDQSVENPLLWELFPGAYSYILQVTTDSTFSSGFIINDSTVIDTFKIVRNLQFGSRHFWRVKARIPEGTSLWSEVWNFTTSEYPELTVRQIQQDSQDSLLLADSLQYASPPAWTLQAAARRGIPVRLTAYCVVPPTELVIGAPTMIAYDTGGNGAAWRGIPVQIDPEYQPGGFMKIRQGDVVQMRGIVDETPSNSLNSTSIFMCRFLKVVDSLHSPPSALQVSIPDFYTGTYPGGAVVYSRGEQYEGMMVELHNVTVAALIDTTAGTFELVDGNSNTMITSDDSRWYTLGNRRDSLARYSTPPVGAGIDTIRGVIIAGSGSDIGEVNYGYRLVPVSPGSIVYSSTNRSVIRGTVFTDLNADSVRNPGEPGIPFVRVNVAGDSYATTLTDADGSYALDGLGAGRYGVTENTPFDARVTEPHDGFYIVTMSAHDTLSAMDFGIHESLNSVSGIVYFDVNENGQYDSTDKPLAGWVVRLTGYISDSVVTDTAGRYAFYRVYYGTSLVILQMQPTWEQMYPPVQQGFTFDIQGVDQHYAGVNFSVHHIPQRVKLVLTVHDNSYLDERDVWWGVRPGATYGIWGVDPHCSTADFSEGEFELPPVLPNIFDVRFLDPHGSDLQFGGGSWTDMRNYVSPTQVDTYLVKFSPGRVDGADYPMTLRWSKQRVRSSYTGIVALVDRFGLSVDLKQEDSVVVTNSNISSLMLIANNPLLPPEGVARGPAPLPKEFALEQNFPNPFNPTTTFRYALPEGAKVRLRIYNLLGQEVKTIVDGVQEAGYHSVEWSASAMASGIYFYRLNAVSLSEPLRSFAEVRKMLLLK